MAHDETRKDRARGGGKGVRKEGRSVVVKLVGKRVAS
jgi:hypothetical protein